MAADTQTLLEHNESLRRLRDKGYAIAIDTGFLVIRDVPYLDNGGNLQWGAIVSTLVFVDDRTVTQDDHQVWFAGSSPYGLDGTPIQSLADRPATLALGEASRDVVVERRFSNKPPKTGQYDDLYHKVDSYVTLISGPAMYRDNVTPYTFRQAERVSDSVFKFHDTLTSRAQIGDLSERLSNDVVAIIGLGGTGSYVLDFLVKTPVKEIRGFDADDYHVHNAYRSPGRLIESELGKKKAELYQDRYSSFRLDLKIEAKCIDRESQEDLEGVTFAFVCVDKGEARSAIFDLLIAENIPFIDVGMGLFREGEPINGLVRTGYYPPEKAEELRQRGSVPMSDGEDDIYKANIQISEVNALNACMAVIRFKQLRGFYKDKVDAYTLVQEIGDMKVVGELKPHDD